MELTARFGGRRTSKDRAYPALLALGALDAAAYSVIAPVLPAISREIRAGPALIGVLVASFPAAMIAGFAVAGRLVRRGRIRLVLQLSLLLTAIGAVGFVVGSGFPAYLGSRAVMGLGSGGLWIGITFATLERWPGQEYLCMSRIFAAYSVGGLLGPALGAIGGIHGPFAAYLALVSLGLVAQRALSAAVERREFEPDRTALRLRGFWVASAGILFAVLGLGIVEGVLPLHMASRLSQAEIGALYIGMSLIVSATAAAAASLRPRPILVASTVLMVAGLSAAGATMSIALWLLALALAAVGIGLANIGSLGVLIETVKADRIVTAMVVWSQLGIIGYLLGPLAGGGATQALGFGGLGLVPLAAGAALLVLMGLQMRGASHLRCG
jgi:predicted MFS family arabinose efflux permease